MKGKLYVTVIIFFIFGYCLCNAQDTIQLKDVEILEDVKKKPKERTIKYGNKKSKFVNKIALFNSGSSPLFYLVDSIPYGILQELKFNFAAMCRLDVERDALKLGVMRTEYKLTFYEESENGNLIQINEKPLIIVIEAGNDWHKNITVNVASYNIKKNRFYICLELASEKPCDECAFYVPQHFRADKPLTYRVVRNDSSLHNVEKVSLPTNTGIFLELKTLTRDY
ncbi:hypothetical protein OGH69_04395 [Flavobacterium sp. MFBS3-15]|uniref:hypothetical protein n=1 Tax=Flavobacterium sp. MFBS3-15 TaxID=2989816 RepID=UPI0022363701|nr:hypothetical protein [Flavobacterium sp. MFBS3-15]MCW4468197.1 hypothetical protein [Flavobacterium sp. MFBS3-15]